MREGENSIAMPLLLALREIINQNWGIVAGVMEQEDARLGRHGAKRLLYTNMVWMDGVHGDKKMITMYMCRL